METSLSSLVDNLAEGIHKIWCKDFNRFIEYEIAIENIIKHKCTWCNKDYSDKIHEN